jgi:hypothetical protein
MTNDRRNFVPGGCQFFTVNLAERKSRLLTDHVDFLRAAFRHARARHTIHPRIRGRDTLALTPEAEESATSQGLHGSMMDAGRWLKGSQMTIEAALSVAGAVLVFALIWQSHRATRRRLSEIQGELDALRDLMSRVLLMQMAQKSEPRFSDDIPPPPPADSAETTGTRKTNDALQLEMKLGLTEVDELCAKLITLVPPSEAAPLLWSARPWPQRRKGH